MNVLVKEVNEKHIAFLTAPCGYELNAIFATWDTIIHRAKANGNHDQHKKRYAICHDNPMITPTDKCRYDASIDIDRETEVAAPYSKSLIPSGKYAVAYYKGASGKVSNFYTELYASWLPNSGY